MKKLFFLLVFLTALCVGYAQKGFPKYYEFLAAYNKADSCFQAKNYTSAAELLEKASKIKLEDAFQYDFSDVIYYAACAWALSKNSNKAFNNLELLSEKLKYSDLDKVSNDSDLLSLHDNKRWKNFINKVTQNKSIKEVADKVYAERTTYSGKTEEIIFLPHSASTKKFLDNDSVPFISINYKNFRIYFRGNSYAAMHLSEIKNQLDLGLSRILSVLNASSYNKGVNIIILDTPEEMQQLNGFYVHGGLSMYDQNIVNFIYNKERTLKVKHELYHYISIDVWGKSTFTDRLLQEGGAVYTDNECYYDNPIYGITAYLLSKSKAFPIQSLISDFDNIARNNEVAVYFESASIYKYLYEKYGVEKMKLLWKKGFKDFESIYKMSIKDFENEWKKYLLTIPIPTEINWEQLEKNGCG